MNERLTRKINGGMDAFGAPLVGTYEIIDNTPGLGATKVRCQLGRYEDLADQAGGFDALRDLVRAKAEGRCVVLPDRFIAPYELSDRYWICGWDIEYGTMTVQDRKWREKIEAAMKEGME